MLLNALSLGAVHCLLSSCARRPGLCPGALICEIWSASLQVALGSAASAHRLPSCDSHTLHTPKDALGSFCYTTDVGSWLRARVCLVHVPSAVPGLTGYV